ncbi:hypothetical protein L1887_04026 [Cichorium endivia]|nr:hypothetical protein L1887_04026 [Cichorium endivia]
MEEKNQKSLEQLTATGSGVSKIELTVTGSVNKIELTMILDHPATLSNADGQTEKSKRVVQLTDTLLRKVPLHFPILKLKSKPKTPDVVIKRGEKGNNAEEDEMGK